MKLSILFLSLASALALLTGAVVLPNQDQDEDVRGAFLTSRPKEKAAASDTPVAKPSRRRPKQGGSGSSGSARPNPGGTKGTTPNPPGNDGDKPGTTVVNKQRLGLGLTLFTRDANGLAVRVDPSHVFHKGDRVRVLLETNTDGYLYIFNTTDDGPPIMLYPDADLDEAGNYIQSHVPFEIPSSLAAEERFRWLVFDEHAGNERVFFVFTKEPLNGVPIEDDLISLCRSSSSACPMRPAADVWELVQKEMKQPLTTDRAQRFGTAQTSSEHVATTRGLGLAKDDPAPSLIMMASSSSATLVTALDLIHK